MYISTYIHIYTSIYSGANVIGEHITSIATCLLTVSNCKPLATSSFPTGARERRAQVSAMVRYVCP